MSLHLSVYFSLYKYSVCLLVHFELCRPGHIELWQGSYRPAAQVMLPHASNLASRRKRHCPRQERSVSRPAQPL